MRGCECGRGVCEWVCVCGGGGCRQVQKVVAISDVDCGREPPLRTCEYGEVGSTLIHVALSPHRPTPPITPPITPVRHLRQVSYVDVGARAKPSAGGARLRNGAPHTWKETIHVQAPTTTAKRDHPRNRNHDHNHNHGPILERKLRLQKAYTSSLSRAPPPSPLPHTHAGTRRRTRKLTLMHTYARPHTHSHTL